jgi:aryl-alcohol dehydrogenase (NADP+)
VVRIGKSDLEIFPVQFGGNVLGWTADEPASQGILDAFVDGGGNSIDTADVYGNGTSESILGRWMKERGNRDKLVIASKVGMGKDPAGATRTSILAGIDKSLGRLQTDYLDLYYIHRDDTETPLEETIAALTEVVQAGKVRYVGASNYTADRLAEALRIADETGGAKFVALQPPYNLVNRAVFEGPLAAVTQQHSIGVLTYSSLASGFLTGKYRDDGATVSSPRAERAAQNLNERGKGILAALDSTAAAHDTKVTTVALAWLLARPGVTAPIASASSADQIPALLAAATLELSDEEVAILTAASE